MCRYDDDYAWIVDSYNETVATKPTRCDDCGRAILEDEKFWDVVGDPTDGDLDEREWRIVGPCSGGYPDGADFGIDAIVFTEETEPEVETLAVFRALGFRFDEVKWGPIEFIHSDWCRQCRAAHAWLEDVCSQGTILVSHEDIESHWDEYGNASDLGWAFIKLAWYNRNGWKDRHRNIVPVETIEALTAKAIEYAHTPAGLAGKV